MFVYKKSYDFYTDPGHGWLEVPRVELESLGIDDKITSCSYEDKDLVYLEEDCDMTTFFEAYKKKLGCDPLYTYINEPVEESFVRSLNHYVCD